MSGNTKKFKMNVPYLERWTILLIKEQYMVKSLIQDYARSNNGHLADKSFDILCRYFALCGELVLLVEMFLESVSPTETILELHQLEYVTFKKIASSVASIRKELRTDYNICLEIN